MSNNKEEDFIYECVQLAEEYEQKQQDNYKRGYKRLMEHYQDIFPDFKYESESDKDVTFSILDYYKFWVEKYVIAGSEIFSPDLNPCSVEGVKDFPAELKVNNQTTFGVYYKFINDPKNKGENLSQMFKRINKSLS